MVPSSYPLTESLSRQIKEVFPFNTSGNSPKSFSEASIALASNVFFTTDNLILALKQALRKLEVVSASNPEISAK